MDNTFTQGIVKSIKKFMKRSITAGIAGMPFMIIFMLMIFWLFSSGSPAVYLLCISMFTTGFLVAGIVSGILAFPSIKTAQESFLPGLIAGTVVATIPLFLQLLIISWDIFFRLSGNMPQTYPPALQSAGSINQSVLWALLIIVEIGLSSLCSAISASFIFFRNEFYRYDQKPPEETNIKDLGTLYDELWEDARTLVADMNRSIAVYRIAGLFIAISGIILMVFAFAGWLKVIAGSYSFLDFIFTIAVTICSLAQLVAGPYLLVWYDRLRKRYIRLTRMEKAAGD